MRTSFMTRLCRRYACVYWWHALCGAVLLLAGAVLLFFLGDGFLILPSSLRAAVPGVLGGAVLMLAGVAGWLWRRRTPERIARDFERHDPSLGNVLINLVQIDPPGEAPPATHLLAAEVRRQGETAALALSPRGIFAASRMRLLLVTFFLLLAWGGVAKFGAPMLQAVWPRFLDPEGDHPPYSRVRIVLEPVETEVRYGGGVEIRAHVSGAPVERIWLVSEGEEGGRTVMFRRPDGSYFQMLSNLRHPVRIHATDGRARSHWHSIGILTLPRIERVGMECVPPAYTRLPSRELQAGTDPIRVPAGTGVTVRVTSNRPLAGGSLLLTPMLGGAPVEVALSAPDGGAAVGTFSVEEDVLFAVTVWDTEGLESPDPFRGRFEAIPDRSPRITILEPPVQAVSTPRMTIRVAVEAEDDYGVERILWFRGLNGSVERAVPLLFDPPQNPQRVRAEAVFDLDDLGVRPGDRIEYFFEVIDNDPRGPNLGLSEIHAIRIISEEDFRTILEQAALEENILEDYMHLTAHQRRLAKRAEELAEQPDAESMDAFAEAWKAYEASLAQMLSNPPRFDLEHRFHEELRRQQDQLARLGKEFDDLRQALEDGIDPESLRTRFDSLRDTFAGMHAAMDEEVGEPARLVAQAIELLLLAQRFADMAQEQERIARLLRRFETKPELSRTERIEVRALARQQGELRTVLLAWRERMGELVGELPADPLYEEFRESVEIFLVAFDGADIPPDMHTAAEHLSREEMPEAFDAALRAAEKMLALTNQCDPGNMQGALGECLLFQPTLQGGLGESLQQILDRLQGRGRGRGGSGMGLYGSGTGVYGPDMPGVRRATSRARGRGRQRRAPGGTETTHTDPSADSALPVLDRSGRVPLQRNARFPLRYREHVGEYFRRMAEMEEDR